MYSIDEDRSGHWWTPHKVRVGRNQHPAFAERVIWNIRLGLVHSGLMFAARITLPHFSV